MADRDEPTGSRGTDPVEAVDPAEQTQQLARARATGTVVAAGRLLGLLELPGETCRPT